MQQRVTLHWSEYPQREQDETQKSRYGLDWLQKGVWYGPTKLDKKLPQNVQNQTKTMKTWRVELKAGEKSFVEGKIQRRIFQGDSLSPLLFITAMMPLNYIVRKCTAGYKLIKSQEKINHLIYIDDIKPFAKNEKELKTLIHVNFETENRNVSIFWIWIYVGCVNLRQPKRLQSRCGDI